MISNFIPLRNLIPWRRTILYIDQYENYLADEKFIAAGVPIRFKGVAANKEIVSPFCFVFCSFNKKYAPQVADVLTAMDILLSLKYGQKYEDFKQEANKILEGGFDVDEDENGEE